MNREPDDREQPLRAKGLIPFRRLMAAVLLLVAPTILALDLFVFVGDLSVEAALVVVGAGLTASAAVVWFVYQDLMAIGHYLLALARDERPNVPSPRLGILRDLTASIARLDRRWRTRYRAVQLRRGLDEEVLENLGEGVLLIDREGRVLRANAAGRAMIGMEGAPMNRPLLERLLELPGGTPDLAAMGRAGQLFEARPRGAGGEEIFYSGMLTPFSLGRLAGADDELAAELVRQYGPIAGVVTLHDITERRRVERMRDRFLANAGHELRTPLASIAAAVETIGDSARTDEAARDRFLAVIDRQAQRMRGLIDDLLLLARETPPEKACPMTGTARLETLVREAQMLFAPRLEAAELSLAAVIDPGLPALALPPAKAMRILHNLLDNAIKYSPEGGDIIIGVRSVPDAGQIRLWVRDTGIGMTPEVQARLTERFYRAPEAEQVADGLGLGLAILAAVLAEHGGRMQVESSPGQGSTFTIDLPAATADEVTRSAA